MHALVLERAATKHRHDFHLQSCVAQGVLDFLLGDSRGVVEVFSHEVIVELGDFLQHLVAILLALVEHVGGNVLNRVLSTHCLVVPVQGFHSHQVNHTLEVLLGADWQLDGAWVSAQHIVQLACYLEVVGAGTVHLVDIGDAGHIVLVGLTPHCLALRLNASHSAESGDCSVKNPE